MTLPPNHSPVDIRRDHLKSEARVRSVFWIHAVVAVMMLGNAAGIWVSPILDMPTNGKILMTVLCLLFAGCFGWVAVQFLKLNPGVRIPGIVLSILGLLNFPVGTILNGYVLYVLFSREGRDILSPEYRSVLDKTPEYRFRLGAGVIAMGIAAGLAIFLYVLYQAKNPRLPAPPAAAAASATPAPSPSTPAPQPSPTP